MKDPLCGRASRLCGVPESGGGADSASDRQYQFSCVSGRVLAGRGGHRDDAPWPQGLVRRAGARPRLRALPERGRRGRALRHGLGRLLPIKGGTPPEPEQPVITSITVDRDEDVVRVGFTTQPGFTYVLLRSPTVAPLSAYTNVVACGVATKTNLTLVDADKNRPKDQTFYIVEAR